MSAFFFKHPEGIDVAGFDEFGYPFPFHRHKTAVIHIFFRAREVDFRMSRVDIAGYNDRFLFSVGFDEGEKAFIKFHFEF